MVSITPFDIRRSLAKNRNVVMSQLERLIDLAIATGEDAALTARKVRAYFSPMFSPIRKPTGGLLRIARTALQPVWPGRAGMASQFARGLMLHETTVAYGVAAITRAERTPGLGVRWRLAPGHARVDDCDAKANGSSRGQDRGVYEPGEFPPFPSHYRCRCIADTVPLRAR